MPVHLRSITGKVDYEVEQVIRDLVVQANRQEAESSTIIRQVQPQVAQLATTVRSLGDLARTTRVASADLGTLGIQVSGNTTSITNIISNPPAHNLLSATHPDTVPASPTRGALVVGNATPAWAALALGANGTFLASDGTDAAWSQIPAISSTYFASLSGANLTALNASNISTGTLADARLSTNVPLKNAANTFTAQNTWTTFPLEAQAGVRVQSTNFASSNQTSMGFVVDNGGGNLVGFIIGDVGFLGGTSLSAEIPSAAGGTGNVGGSFFRIGRNSSGSGAAGIFALRMLDNNQRFLWVDATGDLRISSSFPHEDGTPSDTSGTVVGDQTSTEDTKEILGPFDAPDQALALVRATALVRFRYRSGSRNRSIFIGPLAEQSPEFAMDAGRSFNPISAFGYTASAIKALATRTDDLAARVAALESR